MISAKMSGRLLSVIRKPERISCTARSSAIRLLKAWRFLLRWSIISLFAMLINPYGIFSYDIFFEFVSGNTMVSVTNEFLMTPWKGREAFWLFLGGVFLSLFVSSRTRDLTNILLFFPFAYLAVRYVRGAEAFGPTMIPILGFNLSRLLEKVRDTRTVQFCFLAVGAASLLFVVYYKFFAPKHQYSFGYTINENYLPGGSARFVKEAGLEGNLFNSGKFGGYLSYFLFPDYKIYHYMHHILFDITNLDVTSPGVWERWKRKNWDITFAIAGNEKEITMFSSNGFVPVYKEEAATVLVKKEGRNQKVLDLFEIKHFDPFWSKAKFRSLASDETVYPDLMREMSTYLTYRADSFVADIFGELILSENSVLSADKKLALIEHAQKFNQRNSWLKAAEGMLYYRKKNMDRARIALSEAVRLKKGFVWAKLNLAYVLYDLGRFGEAADTFGQILETNPTSAEALYGSALAHFRLNMSSLARAEWEKYLKLAPQGKWSKKAREFLKKIK
ncbi:MAG: tetratricopeptide repeat protein, partial [Nitrospinota bacterium]